MNAGLYDMDGQPLEALEWARRYEDFDSRVIAVTMMEPVTIRTVWTGLHCPPSQDGIFGTALYRPGHPAEEVRQYHTKAQALAGHAKVVEEWAALRELCE